MANRNVFKLGGRRNDLEQALELCLLRERHTENVNGDIVDVVVCRDHAQVERRSIHCDVSGEQGSVQRGKR
jgi:hypothetical protein